MLRLALVIALLPSYVDAGFINNRSDWAKLDEFEKHGYVMGAYDELATSFILMTPNFSTLRGGIATCVYDLGLTTNDLVDVIEQEYEDLSNWRLPAYSVLVGGLTEICRSNINSLRRERNLEPLP